MSKYVRSQHIALISALMLGVAQPTQAGFFNNSAYLSANKADESGDFAKAAKLYVKVVVVIDIF